MVDRLALAGNCLFEPIGRLLLATSDPAVPLLVRLDPERRATVLMALLGVILVGGVLIALAVLGGRHLRRIVRKPLGPSERHEESWYRKPLISPDSKSPGARDPE